MGQCFTYFTIPFDKLSTLPACTVWFATWTTKRPAVAPGMTPPFVVGATPGELPAGAVSLGNGATDPPLPPPPPPSPTISFTQYQKSVGQWLADGSTTERYHYFAIPLDQLPAATTYPVWYAQWCNDKPVIAPGTLPPHVVGATAGPLPLGATELATAIKDPPPPPLASPVPGTDLAGYKNAVAQSLVDGRSFITAG